MVSTIESKGRPIAGPFLGRAPGARLRRLELYPEMILDPKGDGLMLDTQRPQIMTVEEAEAIKADSCGPRRRFRPGAAHRVAGRRNAQRAPGERRWSAYRCSFANDGHWHVGPVITVEGMARVALAIRTLCQAS